MKQSIMGVGLVAAIALGVSSGAWAQQRARGGGVTRATAGRVAVQPTVIREVVTLPVSEAASMLQRQGVYIMAPPAGATAYGLASLGQGTRVWALLPSCRRPNPDDPRDPCPVGRVTMVVAGGSGTISGTEPQTLTESPDDRRVQSFVIPASATTVSIRILRRDDAMRYEANVDGSALGQLETAQGTAGGARGFTFELSAYPGR